MDHRPPRRHNELCAWVPLLCGVHCAQTRGGCYPRRCLRSDERRAVRGAKGAGRLFEREANKGFGGGYSHKNLLATGFPYDRKVSDKNNLNYFYDLLMASQEVRRDGSAALDLCYVATGRLDGFWELKLKPWDVAAGSLIVKEAGGIVSDFSGNRFDMQAEEILASNGRIHRQMIKVMQKS